MKTLKLRLTLNVEFDPQGVSEGDLIHNMNQIVKDAVNNGTLTGELPSTVETYDYKVEKVDQAPMVAVYVEGGVVQEARSNVEGIAIEVLDVDNLKESKTRKQIDKAWAELEKKCPVPIL